MTLINTIFFCVLIGLPLLLVVKSRKKIIDFIHGKYKEKENRLYGPIFEPLKKRFCEIIRLIKKHKHRPNNIDPLLNQYKKKICKALIQANKISIIKNRIDNHYTITADVIPIEKKNNSHEYISTIYNKMKTHICRELNNLIELYSICERKTVDLIILKKEDYVYDDYIKALNDGMNELDKIYDTDLLDRIYPQQEDAMTQ